MKLKMILVVALSLIFLVSFFPIGAFSYGAFDKEEFKGYDFSFFIGTAMVCSTSLYLLVKILTDSDRK